MDVLLQNTKNVVFPQAIYFFYTFQNSDTFTNFPYQAYVVGPVKKAVNNNPKKFTWFHHIYSIFINAKFK